jgi:hypothetical protein
MKRIDSANVHADLFGPGKDGFQGGNPALNLPATFFTDDWCNHVQEEIAKVIEHFGVALNGAQYDQLLQVLLANFASRQAFAGEIGKISYVPSTVPTENHMPVFGSLVSRTGAYAELWTFAQASGALVTDAVQASRPGCFSYGPDGVGGTTFRVPKLAGLVIKSYHNGDGTYTTNTTALMGAYLPDVIKSHNHETLTGASEGDSWNTYTNGNGPNATNVPTTYTGDLENTVRSVVLYPQIRYKSF